MPDNTSEPDGDSDSQLDSEQEEQEEQQTQNTSLGSSVRQLTPNSVYGGAGFGLFIGFANWILPLFMGSDLERLEDKYGIERTNQRYLYYALCFVLGTFGPMIYLFQRRTRLLRSSAFNRDAFDKAKADINAGYPLLALAGLGLFILGIVVPTEMSTIGGFMILFGLIATPIGVFYDQRQIRSKDVVWGKIRYLHVLANILPFFLFVYLFQRSEHIFYTALAKSQV